MFTEQILETPPRPAPPDGYYVYQVWHPGAEQATKIGAATSQEACEHYLKRLQPQEETTVYVQNNAAVVTFNVVPVPTLSYNLTIK